MEGFEFKNTRADFYKEIKDKSNEFPAEVKKDDVNVMSERQKLYKTIQGKIEYKEAQEAHKKEIEGTEAYKQEARKLVDDLEKDVDNPYNDGVYVGGLQPFMSLSKKEMKRKLNQKNMFDLIKNIFKDIFYNQDKSDKKTIEIYKILKKSLKDSDLVDLGCGSPRSVEEAYEFSALFNCKKYIGVDKYFKRYRSDNKSIESKYDTVFEKIQSILKQRNKNMLIDIAQHELIKEDMLGFLSKRTKQSNFMLNGVEIGYIIPTGNEGINYMDKVFFHISRLVPEGGVVIGHKTTHFPLLEKYGFVLLKTDQFGKDLEVWKKTK